LGKILQAEKIICSIADFRVAGTIAAQQGRYFLRRSSPSALLREKTPAVWQLQHARYRMTVCFYVGVKVVLRRSNLRTCRRAATTRYDDVRGLILAELKAALHEHTERLRNIAVGKLVKRREGLSEKRSA